MENRGDENEGGAQRYYRGESGVVRVPPRVQRREAQRRYPGRNRISPVRWWIGERAEYDGQGFLLGKVVRR